MKQHSTIIFIILLSIIYCNTLIANNYPTIVISVEITDKQTGISIPNAAAQLIILNETEHCLSELIEPSPPFYDTINFTSHETGNFTRRYMPKNYFIKVNHPDYFNAVQKDSFDKCNSHTYIKIVLDKVPQLKNCEKDLIKKMGDNSYISISKIRYGLSTNIGIDIDSQYVHYEKLLECASNYELKKLLNSENNIILCFAWKAYSLKMPNDAINYLFNHQSKLRKKEVTKFISYCQGYTDIKVIDFMINQFYSYLLLEEVSITSDKIIQLLKLKELRISEKHKERNDTLLKDF